MNWQLLTRVIDQKKGQNLVFLCQNPADVQRFRILVHQHYPENTLFKTRFLTLTQWAMKSLTEAGDQNRETASPLQMRILTGRCLKNTKIEPRTGFVSDILDLFESTSWHQVQTADYTQTSEAETARLAVTALRKEISRFNLQHLSEAISIDQNRVSPEHYHVFWLLPSVLTYVEQRLMMFIDALYQPTYDVFACNNQNRHLQTEPNAAVEWFISTPAHKRVQIHPVEPRSKISRSAFKNCHSLELQNSKSLSVHLARPVNFVAEAVMVARQCRLLLSQGAQPQDISILYCQHEQANHLRSAFKEASVPLDLQVRINASNLGAVEIARLLLKCFTSPKGKIAQADLSSMVQNRSLNLKAIFKKTRGTTRLRLQLVKSIKKLPRFFYTRKAMNLSPDEQLQELLGFIASQKNNLVKLEGAALISDYLVNLFHGLLLPATDYATESYQATLGLLDNTLREMSELDRIYENPVSFEEFMKILQQELDRSQIVSAQPDYPEEILYSERPPGQGVIARYIAEGLHSPCDHLFITNSTEKAYPVHQKYLLASRILKKPVSINLSIHQQNIRLYSSLGLVSKSIVLSFPLDASETASTLFFNLAKRGLGEARKSQLLDQVAIFSHFPGEKPQVNGASAPALAIAREKLIFNGRQPGNELKALEKKIITHNNVSFNRLENLEFSPFTGLTFSSRSSSMSSSSHLEELAACPQRFWFRRRLKLREDEDHEMVDRASKKYLGLFFHAAAKGLIDLIIERYPASSYQKIFQLLDKEAFQTMLEEVIVNLDFKLPPAILGLVRKVESNRYIQIFLSYFQTFYDLCLEGKHPLAQFYPVATEAGFKSLQVGPFSFEGSIDRIDYDRRNKKLFITDYKVGSVPRQAASYIDEGLKELTRIQLPIYMLAALKDSHLVSLRHDVVLAMASYDFVNADRELVLLPEPGKLQNWYQNDLAEKQVRQLQSDLPTAREIETLLENKLKILANHYHQGEFFVIPRKKQHDESKDWQAPCKYCEFMPICDAQPYSRSFARMKEAKLTTDLFHSFFSEED